MLSRACVFTHSLMYTHTLHNIYRHIFIKFNILFFVFQQTASQGEGDVAGLMEEDALSGPEAGDSNGVELDDDKQEIVQSQQGYSSTTNGGRHANQSDGALENISEECHTHNDIHFPDKRDIKIPRRPSLTRDDDEFNSGTFVFRSSHDAGSLNANIKEYKSVSSSHKEPSLTTQDFVDESTKTSTLFPSQSNNCVFDSRHRVGLDIVKTNGAVTDNRGQKLRGGSSVSELVEEKHKETVTNGYHGNGKDSGNADEPVRRTSFSDLRSRFESAMENTREPQVKRNISATKVTNGLVRSAVSTSYLTLQTSKESEVNDKPHIKSVTDSACHGDNVCVTTIDVDEHVQNNVDANDIVDDGNCKSEGDGFVEVSNHKSVASVCISTSSCDDVVREGEPMKDVESIDTSTCVEQDSHDDGGVSCVVAEQETQVSTATVTLSVSNIPEDEHKSDIMDLMEQQSDASLSVEENGEVVKTDLPYEPNMLGAGEDIDQDEGNTKGDAIMNGDVIYMGKESK